MKSKITELKKRLTEIAHLRSVLALLDWDSAVNLPPKANDSRASSMAELSSIVHAKFIAIDHDGLLSDLKKEYDAKKIRGNDAVIVFETWESVNRMKKLPDSFVREIAQVTSRAQRVWADARQKNDFKIFLPWLTKIVTLKKQEAELLGYKNSPYDALIDTYEPGMTADEAMKILNNLKSFLTPFIQKIQKSKKKINPKKLHGIFPIEKQILFNESLIRKIGFDFEAGLLSKTVHPFATGLHPLDVRITTRYAEHDALYSLGSAIHETGHGLYEQGLLAEHFGTPIAEAISLGIHESQSRLWENLIGKSKEFWKHFYPKLQKEFPKPFKQIPLNEFYMIINNVTPSLIRTESDEVTYNLHIILRTEIEKEMIEGTIALKDLPKIWNARMKEYFGIVVPSDSLGVLQDVHWSAGLIGYFPTYAFGNLYSAQFYHAMDNAIPDMKDKIARGEFTEMREWLRKNIHMHGKAHTAESLVKKVTGEALNSKYFTEYLEKKYNTLF